jgi:hypothetical protein
MNEGIDLHTYIIKIVVILFLVNHFLMGQDFVGDFRIPGEGEEILLTLHKRGPQAFSGSMTGSGNSFDVSGTVQNGVLVGTVGEGGVIFQAQLNGDILVFYMMESDEFGNPYQESLQMFQFQRMAPEITSKIEKDRTEAGDVVINDITLNTDQMTDIVNAYGVQPLAGQYWYDTKSGLYGVIGYPAYGFMLPGHEFGILDREASAGDTGVLVNGRELSQAEWAVWSYMLGYWIQQGAYWLDHQGNAGYEGNPVPLVNLYVAAQQNAYNGQGGSGDNFWSTRFGAGNYDSGNQRGYVSVPGHGPVGYGF